MAEQARVMPSLIDIRRRIRSVKNQSRTLEAALDPGITASSSILPIPAIKVLGVPTPVALLITFKQLKNLIDRCSAMRRLR